MKTLSHAIALAATLAFAHDGPERNFQDDLLAKLEGAWKLTGTIRGNAIEHAVTARWVLNHQFLQVQERAVPATTYEALVMIGYDYTSERYVAHWMDTYGGRFSETLGFGSRSGDSVGFLFEYPDGPFRTTFRWLPDRQEWQWTMRQKDRSGHWTDFANVKLARTRDD